MDQHVSLLAAGTAWIRAQLAVNADVQADLLTRAERLRVVAEARAEFFDSLSQAPPAASLTKLELTETEMAVLVAIATAEHAHDIRVSLERFAPHCPSAITSKPATCDRLKTGHFGRSGTVVDYFESESLGKLAA